MNIALLYQKNEPPEENGIKKPMKKGGYSDSSADIAYELIHNGYNIILPTQNPCKTNDYDWCFPDDNNGIIQAIEKGADVLWLNTILYNGHPIEKYINNKVQVIGQKPHDVQMYDDKFYTNQLLLSHGLPVINAHIIKSYTEYCGKYPCVIKPIRGRGSQGVFIAKNSSTLDEIINNLSSENIYGSKYMVEPFLSGEEITITVFPPNKEHPTPYCLPPVLRFMHINGIAPYNGTVAVAENSRAVENDTDYHEIMNACTQAYRILNLKAPIRIDCRKNHNNNFFIFDVNMKPNMTLASRKHRFNQDSLVMLAAKQAGLSRLALLEAFIDTAWD